MRQSMMVKVAALCVLAASGAAMAAGAYRAQATLVKAVPAQTDTEVDGVNWHCSGNTCVGTAEKRSTLDSYMKECRKVAAALGELASYSSRGREMSKPDLAVCNSAARS